MVVIAVVIAAATAATADDGFSFVHSHLLYNNIQTLKLFFLAKSSYFLTTVKTTFNQSLSTFLNTALFFFSIHPVVFWRIKLLPLTSFFAPKTTVTLLHLSAVINCNTFFVQIKTTVVITERSEKKSAKKELLNNVANIEKKKYITNSSFSPSYSEKQKKKATFQTLKIHSSFVLFIWMKEEAWRWGMKWVG